MCFVLEFGPSQRDWSKNKTQETSTSEQMISSVLGPEILLPMGCVKLGN